MATTTTITIQVDPDVAQAYAVSAPQDQLHIQQLINLWLRELTSTETLPLSQLMDQVSNYAQAQGLTPELLESLLDGE